VLEEVGAGCVVFTALAQGLLTDKYLGGVPEDSRAARDGSLPRSLLSGETLERVRRLDEIARGRGQTLAQLALAWVLRDPRVTSTVVGASSVGQLEANVAALDRLRFSADELAEIDRWASDLRDVDLWRSQAEIGADPAGPARAPAPG
jgi:L-glyceraldehyde 3-phosphate reductase